MTVFRAHIYKQRQTGLREEVKIKVFDSENEPIGLSDSGTPSAVYTASVNGDSSSSTDIPIGWEAAPTYDPSTFSLDEDGHIYVVRSGIYRLTLIGEPGLPMPKEDLWNFRFPINDSRDETSWAWSSHDHLATDNTKVGWRMHADIVFSAETAMVLPVVLDFNAAEDASFDLIAFPQRLGDFSGVGDREYLPV